MLGKEKNIKFVNSPEDLGTVGASKKDRYVAGSNYVFVTMKPGLEPGGHFRFLASKAVSFLPWRQKQKLYFWVDKMLVKTQEETGANISLLQFYYLRFGLLFPGTTILYGGGDGPRGTNLEYFVFRNGVLQYNGEYMLPEVNGGRFLEELKQKIKETMPEKVSRAFYCAPLPENEEINDMLQSLGVKKPGRLMFDIPTSFKLSSTKKSLVSRTIAATLLISLLGFSLPVWLGWSEYKGAVQEWKDEIKGYESTYAEGDQRLDMLETQRFFLEKRTKQESKIDDARGVLATISSISGAKVDLLEFGVDHKEYTPYTLSFNVPVDENLELLDHAEKLIQVIVSSVGGEATLDEFREGILRSGKTSEKRRTFVLQGRIY